jgi:hypothetical protein
VFKLLRDGSVEDFTRGPGFLYQSTIDTQRHAGHAPSVADRYTQSRIGMDAFQEDRRRSRTKPFRDRVARRYFVAERTAPRERIDNGLGIF